MPTQYAKKQGVPTPTPAMSHLMPRQEVTTVVSHTSSVEAPGRTVTLERTSTSYAPPPPQTNSPEPEKNDSSTPAGPVAGGVVGGVVGLALILGVLWYLIHRIRRNRATRALDDMYAETGMGGGGVDRHARTRANNPATMPLSSSWDSGTPIHMEQDMYDAPMAVPTDPTQTAFAAPIHSQARQDSLDAPGFITHPLEADVPWQTHIIPEDPSVSVAHQAPHESYVPEALRVTNAGLEPTTPPSMPAYAQEAEQAVEENPRMGTLISERTQPPGTGTQVNPTLLTVRPDNSTSPSGTIPPGTSHSGTALQSTPAELSVNTNHLERNASLAEDERSPLSMYMWLPSHKVAGITSPSQTASQTPATNTVSTGDYSTQTLNHVNSSS